MKKAAVLKIKIVCAICLVAVSAKAYDDSLERPANLVMVACDHNQSCKKYVLKPAHTFYSAVDVGKKNHTQGVMTLSDCHDFLISHQREIMARIALTVFDKPIKKVFCEFADRTPI